MDSLIFILSHIGEAGVGKTNILHRIINDEFNPFAKSTIGVDFYSKKTFIEGVSINIEIWDTAGAERFHSLSKSFYRQSMGAFLVYDVTDRMSLISVTKWLEEFQSQALPNACFMVLGNKCDSNQRQISFEEGNEFANSYNLSFYETSSLTSENINIAFESMVKGINKYI